MIFIRFDVKIFNCFFLFRLFIIFRELELVYLILHGLPSCLCSQAGFLSSPPVGSLDCLFQHPGLGILCKPFLSSQPQNPVKKILLWPVSLFVNKVFLNVTAPSDVIS